MSRYFKSIVGATLILILLLFSACAKAPAGVSSFPLGSEIRSSPSMDTSLHMSFKEDYMQIVSSGSYTLLCDNRSAGIAVYDSAADEYWTALPLWVNSSGAVLTAALVSDAGRYYLNSQDNSVFFGSYKTKTTDNGITITYVMSDEATSAAKKPETLSPGELYVRIPVSFLLIDGELRVSVACDEIFISPGYVLESLALMPYFGALPDEVQTSASYGNFLLVPDGCGAVMYTDQTDAATDNLTFRVYGNDAGVNVANAAVGCFGISRGNAAMAGVICSGDAVSSVRAIRASANTDAVNIVYPEFNLTPYGVTDKTYSYGAVYNGRIEVRYQFLSHTSGAYAPLASACREMLIRGDLLTDQTVTRGNYPMNVSFIFSVNGRASTSAGKLEQAEEVSGLLKAKGVNDLNLVLNGTFSNGLYQTDSYSVLRSAGGKKALKSLCGYAEAQKISVYAAVNLFTEAASSRAAADLYGKKQKTRIENPLYPYVSAASETRYLAAADQIERNVLSLLEGTAGLSLSGYAVSDACSLYADQGSGADAQRIAVLAQDAFSSIRAQKQLVIRGGLFRFLNTASLVTELPEGVAFTQSDAYVCVPLLQMILHGSVVYSGEPCNTSGLLTLSMLKCVEYGASVSVEWDFLPQSDLFYERTYSETADFYVRANAVLGDLADRRITGHEKISDGVFVVTYDSGTIIYINYNNYSVNIGSISVPPYDFLRIN